MGGKSKQPRLFVDNGVSVARTAARRIDGKIEQFLKPLNKSAFSPNL
jgi:hypothetical protein